MGLPLVNLCEHLSREQAHSTDPSHPECHANKELSTNNGVGKGPTPLTPSPLRGEGTL